jgi:hypothetical protein
MRQIQWVALIPVVLLSAGWSAAGAGAELDAKATDYFVVKWSQISYTKTDTVQNLPETGTKPETTENLTLSCALTIRDPNLVLGTIQEGVVTQLTGRQGQDIEVSPPQSRAWLHYERPRYEHRYTQPPAVPQWKRVVESVLRLSSSQSRRPKRVVELQPSHISLQLDTRTLDRAGGELSLVKGYFYAVIAESVENVDLPFEPNDRWVRLTPTLEVQVRQASSTGSSFHCEIEPRPQDQFVQPLKLNDPLPSRLVVARRLLGPDGKPKDFFDGGASWLPLMVRAGMAGSTDGPIKTLRFVIAVNPTHRRIPFEFHQVPLPDPNQPPARHQPRK